MVGYSVSIVCRGRRAPKTSRWQAITNAFDITPIPDTDRWCAKEFVDNSRLITLKSCISNGVTDPRWIRKTGKAQLPDYW